MEHLKYMHNFYELPGFGWGGLEGKVIIYKPTLVKQMSGKKTNKKKKKFCQTAWTYLQIYYYDHHIAIGVKTTLKEIDKIAQLHMHTHTHTHTHTYIYIYIYILTER